MGMHYYAVQSRFERGTVRDDTLLPPGELLIFNNRRERDQYVYCVDRPEEGSHVYDVDADTAKRMIIQAMGSYIMEHGMYETMGQIPEHMSMSALINWYERVNGAM